jgi:hypothetical protein
VIEKFFAADDLPEDVLGARPLAMRNVQTEVCLRAFQSGDLARGRRALVGAMTSGANPLVATIRLGWFALDALVPDSLPALKRLRPTVSSARRRLRDRLFTPPTRNGSHEPA